MPTSEASTGGLIQPKTRPLLRQRKGQGTPHLTPTFQHSPMNCGSGILTPMLAAKNKEQTERPGHPPMGKTLIWHIASAVLLGGFVEFYIWSQSGSLNYDSDRVKALLICFYFLLAVGSQYLFSWFVGYGIAEASRMNFILAAIVSLWLTFSAFALHPGLAKEQHVSWLAVLSVFMRFLATIGLATFLARFVTAVVCKRLVPGK